MVISDFGFRIEKKLQSRNLISSAQSAFRIPKSAIEILQYSKKKNLSIKP